MGKETKVEVQKDGAWMEAVVVVAYGSGQGRRYKVRYDHHPNQDGQSLTKEEDVSFIRVRPIPPHTPHNNTYSIGDIVEVSDKGCWWQGVISKVMSTDSEFFLIYLLQNAIRKVYHCSKLRPAQQWLEGKWSRWPSQVTYLVYFWVLFIFLNYLVTALLERESLLLWPIPVWLRTSLSVCRGKLMSFYY